MPNECWQSDFTHYRLTDTTAFPNGVEIITRLDDCTRYALHVTAHRRVTGPIMLATFRETAGQHGIPASTLTDNGMVYTVRLASIGRRGGRNGFEQQLRTWHVAQKNSRPNHPTTCGKVERFQQTMKKWLRKQAVQPATTSSTSPAVSPCASTANSATSASAEPTAEPTSSCSSKTSTSASSTPSPANSSANSPSTPRRTTNPENERSEPTPVGSDLADVLRHHIRSGGRI